MYPWGVPALEGKDTPVVLPGDPLPGGGHFVTTASIPYQYYLNNAGDITFVAALDTADANGMADTGLYVVSHGKSGWWLAAAATSPASAPSPMSIRRAF